MGKAQKRPVPTTESEAPEEAGPLAAGPTAAPSNAELNTNLPATAEDETPALDQSDEIEPMGTTTTEGAGSTTINDVATTTYDFEADSLEAAVDHMMARDAEEFGRLQWVPNMSFETEGNKVTKVDVTLDLNKTMPNWTNSGDASAAEQKEWARFYAALDTHEEGHASIAREHFTGMGEALGKVKANKVQTTWNKKVAANNAAQVKYDATTQHGRTQGTDITLPAATAEAETTVPEVATDAADPNA